MSLRDEIERIISQERQKLETRDKLEDEYNERQRQRFQPMYALLQELADSVGPTYLKVNLDGSAASLKFGRIVPQRSIAADPVWITDIGWLISSNFEGTATLDRSAPLHREKPGFLVWEDDWRVSSDRSNFRQKQHIFANETETIEYLVGEIARAIADRQHQAKR